MRQQYYPVNFKKRTTMNTVKFKDLSEAELKKYNGGFSFLPWIFGIMTSGMIYDSVAHLKKALKLALPIINILLLIVVPIEFGTT